MVSPQPAGDNPMASIHQILKRLIARQRSPFVSVEYQGQTLYKYDPKLDWVRTLKGSQNPEILGEKR
jgi:hypothetical protein